MSGSGILVVASYNAKKLRELKELLSDFPITLKGLNDFPGLKEVEEDGVTFQENAIKKAIGYAKQTNCLTLAEDSGICVDYLKGEPGVYSARFAGLGKSDAENNEKLLKALQNVPNEQRKAAYHCAAALAKPTGIVHVVEETVSGLILGHLAGDGGFGYDPLFFYPDFGKTFAQVSSEMKHQVSHRGKALRKMREFLKDYLKQ